jgi:hypothetical protein
MNVQNVRIIDDSDWDALVVKTYGRPYAFQQQDGCQDRGIVHLTVPDGTDEEHMHDEIPENGEVMGVTFAAWLGRDPAQRLRNQQYDWQLSMWWEQNFYPDIQMVANDLHEKGLLEAGDYIINIDW